MYKFTDTTSNQTSAVRPNEAMSINGRYIEDIIPGYRTLTVQGRELLASDLTTAEIASRDGSILKNRRYPSRSITITYQLICADSGAFRNAYDKLNEILNTTNAKIIFADQVDRFYIGTPRNCGEVPTGRNSVVADFEILCLTPFKFSVSEYTVQAINGVFNVNYNGTVPSSPLFSVDFAQKQHGESGYVVFSDAQSHVIQLGDPKELDTTSHTESETLIDDKFNEATLGSWSKNTGKSHEGHLYQGAWQVKESGGKYITPLNYGTNTSAELSGPSVTKEIPADSSGVKGAKNFEMSYYLVWSLNDSCDPRCLGTYECMIHDDSGNVVAGVELLKWYSGTAANAKIYAGGKYVHYFEFDAGYFSDWFGFGYAGHPPVRTISINKIGDQFRFNIAGRILSYTVPEGKDMKATKVTFASTKYRGMGDTYPPMLNYLFWAKFRKTNVEKFDDIPNKFARGDNLVADCSDGSIKVNNLPRPDLGALGNDWETLKLVPGQNRINFACSAFTTDKPTAKLTYREVFL
ncbi:distal tail protein Dit [Mogibacterium diversum]